MVEYIVEIVFDFSVKELIATQKMLTDLAEKYNSTNYYFYIDPDIEQKNKTCILVTTFNPEDMYSLILFIRDIKQKSKIYVDSIYNSENKLYYASKTYLKLMNNKMSKKVKIDIKKIYNEEDSILVKEIINL